MANLQTDVPLVNAPISDPKTGMITEAWFLFLIQLWRRTGGSGGDTPSGITLDDVLSVEQTFGVSAEESSRDALSVEATVARSMQQEALFDMIFPLAASSVDMVDTTFVAGTDFTPGTTTSLTLSRAFGAIPRLWIYFDAAFQGDDQVLSLVDRTLTFTSPIPVGITNVYVKGLVVG